MTRRPADGGVEGLLRTLYPRVLGALVRRWDDFSAAEDCVQEALLAAADQWPRDGVPDNPRGWLFRVASRRMADHLRSEMARRRREDAVAREAGARTAPAADAEGDDSLILLFMCCHPSLSTASAVALTLRAVGGLTTAEIARAFFVPEATMAQRISRAKQTIRKSGVPFELPGPEDRASRLVAALHVIYLIFNEGYTSSAGPELSRVELSREAIRLARGVHEQLPDEPEAAGLLALMLLTDARRRARATEDGALVPLMEQDRSLWDAEDIGEGVALLEGALARGSVGPYQVQAAISAVHDRAARPEDTDWAEILGLYGLLERMTGNPMVRLNRAVALAMVEGPHAGLALLDTLDDDPRVGGHHRLPAVRAHLLELSGDRGAAARQYEAAAALADNLAERNYLAVKAAEAREGS